MPVNAECSTVFANLFDTCRLLHLSEGYIQIYIQNLIVGDKHNWVDGTNNAIIAPLGSAFQLVRHALHKNTC